MVHVGSRTGLAIETHEPKEWVHALLCSLVRSRGLRLLGRRDWDWSRTVPLLRSTSPSWRGPTGPFRPEVPTSAHGCPSSVREVHRGLRTPAAPPSHAPRPCSATNYHPSSAGPSRHPVAPVPSSSPTCPDGPGLRPSAQPTTVGVVLGSFRPFLARLPGYPDRSAPARPPRPLILRRSIRPTRTYPQSFSTVIVGLVSKHPMYDRGSSRGSRGRCRWVPGCQFFV